MSKEKPLLSQRKSPASKTRQPQRNAFALTTLRSPAIRRFELRILGVLPQAGTAGNDLILARAYGSALQRIGGVPLGASGSPVYQGRRLIGAIAAVFAPDFTMVGITPIAPMLKLTAEPMPTADLSLTSSTYTMPLTILGITSTQALAEAEKRYGLARSIPAAHSTPNKTNAIDNLQPGSPVGVALLTGDVQMGYIGTATLIRNRQLFAFGHPLLFAGATNMPLTSSLILDTTHGDFPQKIGTLGSILGTVVQDRAAGILAILQQKPQLVSIKCQVKDQDRQQTIITQVQATNIASELPFLTYIAALESMQRAMNRVGPGTAQWRWSIQVKGTKELIIVSSMQYDAFDIGFTIAISGEELVSQTLEAGRSPVAMQLDATVTRQQIEGSETN